jgi:hypothetical protein
MRNVEDVMGVKRWLWAFPIHAENDLPGDGIHWEQREEQDFHDLSNSLGA